MVGIREKQEVSDEVLTLAEMVHSKGQRREDEEMEEESRLSEHRP